MSHLRVNISQAERHWQLFSLNYWGNPSYVASQREPLGMEFMTPKRLAVANGIKLIQQKEKTLENKGKKQWKHCQDAFQLIRIRNILTRTEVQLGNFMEQTTLIFIRHGETEWNAEARWQGFLDSPLTPKGQAQAKAMGKRMAHVKFHHLYSSDLGRAYATAKCIEETTGHTILTETFLREKNLGIFEGFTHNELMEQHSALYERFQKFENDFVIPKGESIGQFFDRCVAGFDELVQRHVGETLVVVSHGGVLANLFRFIFDHPFERPSRFEVINTSIHTVSCREGRWKMHTWGDTNHLENLVL